jgi:hypothetical protein
VEVVRLLTSSQLPDFQYFHIRLIYKCNWAKKIKTTFNETQEFL